ncbi:MAG: CU044_2847 family protein [Cyanobacteria bacterium P01_F01_bin.150]
MQSTASSGHRDSATPPQRVQVELDDGVIVQMDVAPVGAESGSGLQEVSGGKKLFPFTGALAGMTKIAEKVAQSVQAVKPTKATVKYGLDLQVEDGSLMAAIVRGSGSASFEITLEWENKPEKDKKEN